MMLLMKTAKARTMNMSMSTNTNMKKKTGSLTMLKIMQTRKKSLKIKKERKTIRAKRRTTQRHHLTGAYLAFANHLRCIEEEIV